MMMNSGPYYAWNIPVAVAHCGYCGMVHSGRCPSVKAFEYHADGSLKRVEGLSFDTVAANVDS